MKTKLLRSLTVVTLVGGILTLTAWAIASSSQQDKQPNQVDNTKREPAVDHVPIVDLESSASSAAITDPQTKAVRRAKGARYAKRTKGLIVDREAPGGMILTSRYMQPLPAFPIGRSAIIAIGEVVDAQAYLSDDKTGVYSEFSLRLEEILKNDSPNPSFPGSLVVAERYGGRVRFPSGRVTFFGNREQGLPRQGRRYVFFLEQADKQYSILTAYELLSGLIYPLDARNAPGRDSANSVGDEYEKTDEARFRSDLQRAINEYSRTVGEKGGAKP